MAVYEKSRKIAHHQIQILQHGEKSEDAYGNCDISNKHEDYFLVKELSDRLPIKDLDLIEFIKIMCNLTAMVEIDCDEGVRCGTCFVQKIDMVTNTPCPCQECGSHRDKKWGKVTLSTALHVVPEEKDAKECTVRLFYDNPDSTDQEKKLSGLKSHSRDLDGDWCALVCVTHDLDLLEKLANLLKEYWKLGHSLKEKYEDSNDNLVVVVSHPHGGPKLLSMGRGKVKDLAREVRDDQDWCHYSYDATTCDGSSGGPVYILGIWNDGFGYWFGHSHNHCGLDNREFGSSTVGVISTYGTVAQSYRIIKIDNENHERDVNNEEAKSGGEIDCQPKEFSPNSDQEILLPVDQYSVDDLPYGCPDNSYSRTQTVPGSGEPCPIYNDIKRNTTRTGIGCMFKVEKYPNNNPFTECKSAECRNHTTEEIRKCAEHRNSSIQKKNKRTVCLNSLTPKTQFAHIYIGAAAPVVYNLDAANTSRLFFYEDGESGISYSVVTHILSIISHILLDSCSDRFTMIYETHNFDIIDRIEKHVWPWKKRMKSLHINNNLCEEYEKNSQLSRDPVVDTTPELTDIVLYPRGRNKQISVSQCTSESHHWKQQDRIYQLVRALLELQCSK